MILFIPLQFFDMGGLFWIFFDMLQSIQILQYLKTESTVELETLYEMMDFFGAIRHYYQKYMPCWEDYDELLKPENRQMKGWGMFNCSDMALK
jgi:hypothetical protein